MLRPYGSRILRREADDVGPAYLGCPVWSAGVKSIHLGFRLVSTNSGLYECEGNDGLSQARHTTAFNGAGRSAKRGKSSGSSEVRVDQSRPGAGPMWSASSWRDDDGDVDALSLLA